MPLNFLIQIFVFPWRKSQYGKNQEMLIESQIKDIYLICINYWMSDSESSVEVEEKYEL